MSPIWSINFVTDSPARAERVRYMVNRRSDYQVAYTVEPLGEGGFDAIVLPAMMLEQDSQKAEWMPMIAYGSQLHLHRAILAGCFDYLKDPWSPEELLFRLGRLFRSSTRPLTSQRLTLQGSVLSSETGTRVQLSHPEATILKHLLINSGEVVPREALFYAIWGRVPESKSRAVDVHISSLRKKMGGLLADNVEGDNPIMSVRRVGYMISDAPGSQS